MARLDGRSDIYAVGCVLYEMLAGQPPFTGRTSQAILARHALDPVPSLRTVRSTVPPSVEHAIITALAKVPADRFASAGELVAALEGASSAGAVAPQSTRTRPRLLVLGAAVIAVLALPMATRAPPVCECGSIEPGNGGGPPISYLGGEPGARLAARWPRGPPFGETR